MPLRSILRHTAPLRERLVLNKLITDIASQPIPNFQKTLQNNHTQLLKNANESLPLLLILTTKRLCKLSQLPYLSLLNPHMAKIWYAYLHSYSLLIQFTQSVEINSILNTNISSTLENEKFTKILQQILDLHEDNIIDLKQGMKESNLSSINENDFLNEHLRERILMRLIANNHISLTTKGQSMLYEKLNVLDVLARSIDFVNGMTMLKYDEKVNVNLSTAIIKGNSELKEDNINWNNLSIHQPIIFPYFADHLEYVFNEMMKNASRAVIENGGGNNHVNILVVLNENGKTPTLQIKISDKGGGIPPLIINKLWEYSFTTVKSSQVPNEMLTSSGRDQTLGVCGDLGIDSPSQIENTQDNVVAGMGYGLPLSLTYCKLFNGDIKLQSVWGKGTDVYLTFRGL